MRLIKGTLVAVRSARLAAIVDGPRGAGIHWGIDEGPVTAGPVAAMRR